jgi:hypothetical protein
MAEQLTQIMISKAVEHRDLLKAAFRDPGVTAYNRLEPRPRTENFERSLRAEVRDALWLLTRQWQMGELEAEDAGSAIDARLMTKKKFLDRAFVKEGQAFKYDDSVPLEGFVEKEKVSFSYALKVQFSHYFLKLHPNALRLKYLPAYQSSYAMDTGLDNQFRGQVDGQNLYTATKKRVLDGEKIYNDIGSGSFDTKAAIDPLDLAAMTQVKNKFKAYYERLFLQPSGGEDNAWHPQQLDYQFSVATPNEANSQIVLGANQYYQGRLDWYAFDQISNARAVSVGRELQGVTESTEAISFIPTGTVFKGMPAARFWEMEDRQIDFGKLNAKTTDHLLLSFAEFGLVYGNDWFVIPYKLPVNTLCEVKALVVTDVFGDRTLVEAADEGVDNQWQRWSMFNLSNQGHIGQYNRLFFLPSTLTTTLESDSLEQVNFIRDEMANMVWGIEDIIPDATSKGINGHEAASKEGVELPAIAQSDAKIRYLLGTTVPENWIPFLPVQKPGSVSDIYFQRASMPDLSSGSTSVVKAKGVMLTEVPKPYYINEEEIPYAGTIVTRSFQRTRWYDGKTFLWIGRQRQTGRGEGNSHLRFDQAEPINKG